MGMVDFEEPFIRLLNQGMVLRDGSAMSKSRGNLVALSEQLDEHGVDAIRLTMSFAGPPEDDIDWNDVSPAASAKYLARAWRIAFEVDSAVGADVSTGSPEIRKATHKFLREFASSIEGFKFNVAVAKAMELTNTLRKGIDSGTGVTDPAIREGAEELAKALSLFAPYAAEDMWHNLGFSSPVALAGMRAADESLLVEDSVTAIFQVNGKLRDKAEVPVGISVVDLEKIALGSESVQRAIGAGEIANVVVREPRLVNIVTK